MVIGCWEIKWLANSGDAAAGIISDINAWLAYKWIIKSLRELFNKLFFTTFQWLKTVTSANRFWSFLSGQLSLVQERARAIFPQDSPRTRLISKHLHDAKENHEKKIAAWNPGGETHACISPPGFPAAIFFAAFFRVTHDGLSERRTTRSLVTRCWILSSAYQASCWHMVQYRCPVSGGMCGHCTVSVYCPGVWTPTHHLLSRQADEPDFHA